MVDIGCACATSRPLFVYMADLALRDLLPKKYKAAIDAFNKEQVKYVKKCDGDGLVKTWENVTLADVLNMY